MKTKVAHDFLVPRRGRVLFMFWLNPDEVHVIVGVRHSAIPTIKFIWCGTCKGDYFRSHRIRPGCTVTIQAEYVQSPKSAYAQYPVLDIQTVLSKGPVSPLRLLLAERVEAKENPWRF